MKPPPTFDPYELLGVDPSADAMTIDRAYKARIRLVHPDVAGEAGLRETKRLNVAREWLLDPELRARLPKPAPKWSAFRSRPTADPEPSWTKEAPSWTRQEPSWTPPAPSRPPRPAWRYDPDEDDPLTFDYGADGARVSAMLEAIRALTDDERARLTYSMGEEPPGSFVRFKEHLGDELWHRSLALHDAVRAVWEEREDEIAPYDFPRGRFRGGGPAIVNAYAQWIVMGDHVRERRPVPDGLEALGQTCTWPWRASVGQPRYGPHHAGTAAFLHDARTLALPAAERLARSWQGNLGRFLYGVPGEDWFPGSRDHDKPELVSGRLAAVDASRIVMPEGLGLEHRSAFYNGLRLTAYVLALGGSPDPRRDWLRPWKDAIDASPSFLDRARYGMPLG